MGTIDEIISLKEEGRTEQEITGMLRQRGLNDKEIADSLSQAKIREAVDAEDSAAGGEQNFAGDSGQMREEQDMPQPSLSALAAEGTMRGMQGGWDSQEGVNEAPITPPGYEGMQPSMMVQEAGEPYQAQQMYQGYGQEVAQYQPYQEVMSSDLITEISEQVVDERLARISDKLEKTFDFRNFAETKITNLDERLKRMEMIIDRLQLSILQKVGDYMKDVQDLKKELVETQKSFKSIAGAKGKQAEKK
jgi:hypothetical protein